MLILLRKRLQPTIPRLKTLKMDNLGSLIHQLLNKLKIWLVFKVPSLTFLSLLLNRFLDTLFMLPPRPVTWMILLLLLHLPYHRLSPQKNQIGTLLEMTLTFVHDVVKSLSEFEFIEASKLATPPKYLYLNMIEKENILKMAEHDPSPDSSYQNSGQ